MILKYEWSDLYYLLKKLFHIKGTLHLKDLLSHFTVFIFGMYSYSSLSVLHVVSRSDVHIDFDFARPFFAYPIGRASKNARPKNRARRSEFVQFWYLTKHWADLPNQTVLNSFSNHDYTECLWPFIVWCPLKGHTYLSKPAAKSCRFA